MASFNIHNPELKFSKPLTTVIVSLEKVGGQAHFTLDAYPDVKIVAPKKVKTLQIDQEVKLSPALSGGDGDYVVTFDEAEKAKKVSARAKAPTGNSPSLGSVISNELK